MLKTIVCVATLFFACQEPPWESKPVPKGLLIEPQAISTKVNYFWHPRDKRTIILVGTIHQADPAYYLHLREILRQCDYVIYEGPLAEKLAPESPELYWYRELIQKPKLFGEDFDRFFAIADLISHPTFRSIFGWWDERTAFDYQQPNWVSGDAVWYMRQEKNGWRNFWKSLQEIASASPVLSRIEFAALSHEFFSKVEAGNATKPEFEKWMRTAFIEYRDLRKPVRDFVTRERDEEALKVLDNLLQNPLQSSKPVTACLKYGWYHTLYMQKLLEERGYEYVTRDSKWIRAITINSSRTK